MYARNYFILDEAEIDGMLMLALFPKRRDRINFSDRTKFEEVLMPEIVKLNEKINYIENLERLLELKRELNTKAFKLTNPESQRLLALYELMFASPLDLKLAVLITIDEM